MHWPQVDGLVQDCSNSIANALELLQSCTKPSKWSSIMTIHQTTKLQSGERVATSELSGYGANSPLSQVITHITVIILYAPVRSRNRET